MSLVSTVYAQLEEWDSPASEPADFGDLEILIGNILTLITTAGAIVLFIMLLIGGFQFLTAGANPEKTEQAKKTITSAVIGLVLIIGVWFIFRIIEAFTGINVTIIKIID